MQGKATTCSNKTESLGPEREERESTPQQQTLSQGVEDSWIVRATPYYQAYDNNSTTVQSTAEEASKKREEVMRLDGSGAVIACHSPKEEGAASQNFVLALPA
jgi:hypothetical protein